MNTITLVFCIILVAVTLLFVLRTKIILAMHYLLYVLFFVCAGLILSALFLPNVYTQVASNSLETAGTLTTVRSFDQGIQNISNVPQNIWEGIQNLFGQKADSTTKTETGPLEQDLYPQLVSSVGGIFRIVALIIGTIGLVIILYMSYATTGAVESVKLKKDIAELRHKILELENRKP